MNQNNFSTTFVFDQTPQEVFAAITNVRGWWMGLNEEEITGGTEKLNDEFSFRAGNGVHYSKQKLVEVIPNQKMVWLITESNLSFLKKKDDWTGTKVIFDITAKAAKTELIFTHEGLNPQIECYDSCAPAWKQYLNLKLLPLITKGKA